MKGFTTRAFLAGVALQWVVACGADMTANMETEQSVAQEKLAQQPMPLFKSCTNLNFDPIAPQGFNHLRNRLSAHLTPHHSAQDLIGIPGDTVTIPAWFSYGMIPHNLFDEDVNVTLDDCSAWAGLKQWTTNDNGAIKVPVSPTYVQLGGYDVVHEVLADGSSAKSRVWGLPRGTHLVVFDI